MVGRTRTGRDWIERASTPALTLTPREYDAVLFDLDGVLTSTARVHAAAWKRLFDEFLQQRSAATGEPFVPFDVATDYPAYVDGKPRADGVRSFLASRGIELPEGTPEDGPDELTVHGLGNRKDRYFLQQLEQSGVERFDSSIALVRALRDIGIRTAVVSSSKNCEAVLKAAGIAGLFEVRVDGLDLSKGLAGKPAPDTFLEAARRLGVPPERAVVVEDSIAGVQAGRAGGFGLVIGVDRGGRCVALRDAGADIVVTDLAEVRASAEPPPPGEVRLPGVPERDPTWILVEDGFVPTREHEIESLFAIGNGFVGMRASLPEGSPLSSPATYVAGVFDATEDSIPALARAPDWSHVSAAVDDTPIALEPAASLDHRRVLDMRQAILWRQWRHRDRAGRVSRIEGMRIASLADRRLLLQSITITPENYSDGLTFEMPALSRTPMRTASGVTVEFAVSTRLVGPCGRPLRPVRVPKPVGGVDEWLVELEIGRTYRVDRVIAVHTSRKARAGGDLRERAQIVCHEGTDALVEAHRLAWRARWDASDVRVDGDDDAQRALRFAAYHLISAANPEDERVSIGARALTGPAYKGHVFWDTEIFMLPFFTLTYPEAARALLMYRYHTLPAARERAARFNYRGALYAWESADTGEDVTPSIVVSPTGEIVRILVAEQEHHISADVAYGVWSYWNATGDEGFLLDAGAEILVETARFWASRVERGADGRFHIRCVIGPDEYHESVDDNAYTNGMAQWNLETAAAVAAMVAQRWPERWEELSARLGIGRDEPADWQHVASQIYSGLDEATGLFEQFDGYFDLEPIDLAAFEPRTAPMDVLLGRERTRRSQVIKQADVLMLLYLLWDRHPPAVREANFRYYEPRTGHGSSLSPGIHAAFAARLGHVERALRYFRQAAEIDLSNGMGNAAGGVHAATLGGLWQAAVFGFGGLSLPSMGPRVEPNLPRAWKGLHFAIQWRGRRSVIDIHSGPNGPRAAVEGQP